MTRIYIIFIACKVNAHSGFTTFVQYLLWVSETLLLQRRGVVNPGFTKFTLI